MNGLMMDYQLTIPSILKRVNQVYPNKRVISKLANEQIHEYTYRDMYKRIIRLMNALKKLGIKPEDRVATFAWNSYRHLELYFAIPSLKAILHTLNIRLFPEQMEFIINHAEDQIIFIDKSLVDVITPLQGKIGKVRNFIVMDDGGKEPSGKLANAIDYEELLSSSLEEECFLQIDENTASALCYTSGTTGEPKGVLYSHRSTYLHSFALCLAGSLAICERDNVLPVVPMFHVNAWAIPYASPMSGANLVFPGPNMLGKSLAELMESYRVTLAAGVPTIWNLLYHHLKNNKHDLASLRAMVIGGSAVPKSLIDNFYKDFGLNIIHAWGMTETSPLGTASILTKEMESLTYNEQLNFKAKQGPPVAGIEIRAIDDDGKEVSWDGKSIGELEVRGPWVAKEYYKNPELKEQFASDGWFKTGDVVCIDENGFMEITDRKKDLIKTRGEWISSVDMENYVMGLKGVLEACAIGRQDNVKDEAPVLYVILSKDAAETIKAKDIYTHLSNKFAHWQLPKLSDIHFVDSIPKTSVGKFDKKELRKRLK
ncbi:MAG: long-chain fatty acid--CoA ligase [Leptospiraceae bacterium]|nr:long-chain fatty acid--CoA ligase [Leptospiraceae bacterium]